MTVGLWDVVTVNCAINVTELANIGGGLSVKDRTKFRAFDKQMCVGDNVRGPLTNVADADACAEWCATNNTLCAQYYAPGKSCYCKNTVGFDLRTGVDRTGYSTVFTI